MIVISTAGWDRAKSIEIGWFSLFYFIFTLFYFLFVYSVTMDAVFDWWTIRARKDDPKILSAFCPKKEKAYGKGLGFLFINPFVVAVKYFILLFIVYTNTVPTVSCDSTVYISETIPCDFRIFPSVVGQKELPEKCCSTCLRELKNMVSPQTPPHVFWVALTWMWMR